MSEPTELGRLKNLVKIAIRYGAKDQSEVFASHPSESREGLSRAVWLMIGNGELVLDDITKGGPLREAAKVYK